MGAAESHILPVYSPPEQIFVRGEGCWIWDENGDKYLDCIAGIAVNALGHAPPVLQKALNEQAGKLGMNYMAADLTRDEHYNIRLGDGYFSRMMDYYGGSYPLAVAAYNAGPGNVNKWLRANGDPRNGSIDWLQWIEEIPIFETKNYVQRVLENAVVYEHMYPDRVRYGGPKSISRFIGKRTPG